MKLADYLHENRVSRLAFSKQIRIAPSHVTKLCQGKTWPGRDLAARISRATNGEVTPNDFLPEIRRSRRIKAVRFAEATE
jgi:DNA-binding transcriptional regulator YdaS (Cro superfamily)